MIKEILKNILKKILPKRIIEAAFKLRTLLYLKCYSLKFKPLVVRKDTSDLSVFHQIFVDKEYILPVKIHPKLIIDGGANCGYACLWYMLQYPQAKIIAIEPEQSNFEILEQNTKKYKNIERIQAGIWNKNTYLKIVDRGYGKWGFMTEEVSENDAYDLKAITIDKILKQSEHNTIDILKLDIEGAEKEVFSSNYEHWLKKVKILIIELHDRMKEGCSQTVYSAIKKFDFIEKRKGENIIFINKNLHIT